MQTSMSFRRYVGEGSGEILGFQTQSIAEYVSNEMSLHNAILTVLKSCELSKKLLTTVNVLKFRYNICWLSGLQITNCLSQ